jgi:hypothetical protein
MNKFMPYIPTFVEMDEEPDPFLFETQEELVDHPYIKKFCEDMGTSHIFYRLEIMVPNILMAVYDEGSFWLVIGRLKSIDGIDLPKLILTSTKTVSAGTLL